MPFKLTWLPTVLKNAGLKVAEDPGWMNRGHGDVNTIKGVMCHHTAGAKTGNMPSHNFIITGSSKLPGPLAQLGLGRDGTFYVIAAGKCFHAGKGVWQGLTDGNGNFIGIEAENTGGTHNPPRPKNPPTRPKADPPFDLPWPDEQMDAYRRGVAAILKHIGQKAIMCCGHKEYRLPIGFKDDPTFDMVQFRTDVAAIMTGSAPTPVLIPSEAPDGRPTLRRPSMGDLVKEAQKKLGFVGIPPMVTSAP
jgi:N-acetylmuramoyl-L-alanine amidase